MRTRRAWEGPCWRGVQARERALSFNYDSSAMTNRHLEHWPRGLPLDITIPATSVYTNLAVSALRYPEKPALVFYDTKVTFSEVERAALALAGHLRQTCGIEKGDRVLLFMQNCPQWVIAYFGVLRADAVV